MHISCPRDNHYELLLRNSPRETVRKKSIAFDIVYTAKLRPRACAAGFTAAKYTYAEHAPNSASFAIRPISLLDAWPAPNALHTFLAVA